MVRTDVYMHNIEYKMSFYYLKNKACEFSSMMSYRIVFYFLVVLEISLLCEIDVLFLVMCYMEWLLAAS